MRVLLIGDIVGKTGRKAVKAFLPTLISRFKIDLTVANCENAAGGFGITEKVAAELFGCGIHVMTSGNHIWDKKEAVSLLVKEDRILRPLNYPPGVPGAGSIIYNLNGRKVGVLNVSGRIFMNTMDCPFRTAEAEVERIRKETEMIIVDLHAEATSEKIAFGRYMDGRVSAVIGTHTHVQTADEQILPKGTAYITDAGMTGPLNSVIGVDTEQIIDKFLTQMPRKFETAKGIALLSGVMVEIDEKSGRATSIQRLQLKTDN
ncbi:MAG TPA: TIGR00282 family metallophosphoesterase [Nitrospirae bacterium]|nr:TIGR00282 family metallophosphoesterase [Nitrospirota bacterium]